jgi:putative pyruvate formate lyase activating enzyme
MIQIIDAVRAKGYDPIIVYNTNSYDSPEVIELLEPYVDVYLADYKYADNLIGERLSGIKNYSHYALPSIRAMIKQKGTELLLDDQGIALKGVIVRHLVLPGQQENSIEVLNSLADMSDSKITLSLMSQYYPAFKAKEIPALNRGLQQEEYQRIVDYLDYLGFENGWIQELESQDTYQPDFNNDHPFEKTN